MLFSVFLRICVVIVGLGFASHATAGSISCGEGGLGCAITLSIDGAQVGQGTYQIDAKTGALSLSSPILGESGVGADILKVSVDSINGNADPILGFAMSASTGNVGGTFAISLSLPISLSGPIFANSSISYSLTALSAAGAQLNPSFGKTLIGQEVDTTPGGLDPLNKGVNAGDKFFFLTGPLTQNSPVYTASNALLVGDLQYDLMSLTVAFSLSAKSTTGLSGFVQQVPIPEPSAVLLLALGLGVLTWRRSH